MKLFFLCNTIFGISEKVLDSKFEGVENISALNYLDVSITHKNM